MKLNSSAALTLLFTCLMCVSARPVVAQERSGLHMFVAGGKLWFPEDDQLGQGDVRICSLTSGRPSADFDLAFGLVDGLVPIGDLDLALPLRVAPGTSLIPRVGVTAMAAFAGGIGGYATGWNTGLGFVLSNLSPLVIRADYSLRQLNGVEKELDGPLQGFTLGIGWTY